MLSYTAFYDLLNEQNLNASSYPDNPAAAINAIAVLPVDGKYQITYTIFQTKTDVLSSGYYGYAASEYTVDEAHYIHAIENAISYILGGDNSGYGALFQNVANIEFIAPASGVGVMTFAQAHNEFPGFQDVRITGAVYTQAHYNNANLYGDIWLNVDNSIGKYNPFNTWEHDDVLASGTRGFTVLLEEISHVLGIDIYGRSTDGFTPIRNQSINNLKYTVTAYNTHLDMKTHAPFYTGEGHANGAYPKGLQLMDIAALQEIYGRNYEERKANTLYSKVTAFSSEEISSAFIYTIWDGGGVDLIDATDYLRGDGLTEAKHQIDLRQGAFSSIGFNGNISDMFGNAAYENVPMDSIRMGQVYDAGNLAIAYYTVIENAIGGNNNDRLIGNAWSNILYGAGGNDVILGDSQTYSRLLGIEDTEFTGDDDRFASDRASGNAWKPSTDADNKNDILLGGKGNDHLFGGEGNDVLHGGYRQSDVSSGSGNVNWDAAGQFTGANNASGVAIADIDYALDGRDTANYSKLAEDVGIVAEFGYINTVVKGVSGAQGTDRLFSIENLIGTAADDSVTVNVNQGGTLSGFDGVSGYDTLQYIGGVRKGTSNDKLYDYSGNLIYDAQKMNDFKNIDSVTLTQASYLMHDEATNAFVGYMPQAIYSLHTEGLTSNISQALSSFQSSGIWYGSESFSNTVTASASVTHTYTDMNSLLGTDYNDTFNISSSGSGLGYNGSVRHLYIFGGKGDDTINVSNLTIHMEAHLTYHSGNDVYTIQGAEDVTVYFDDEILVSQVSVSSTVYDIDNKLTQVVFLIGSDTLTLNGPNLRGLMVEFQSGGWVELGDDVNIYGMTSSSRNVTLDWGDDVYHSSTADETQTMSIKALSGNDTLYSGLGRDTFYGGAGSDTVIKNDTGGDLHFVGGEGVDSDIDTLDYRSISGPMDYTIDGDKITTVLGVDTFSGVDRVFLSNGGGSVTVLNASSAVITPGTGGNTVYGSNGNDTIQSGTGSETVYGADGHDTLYAAFGSDKVYGEAGNDTLSVFAGNHTVDGGDGDDVIILQDFFTGYHSTMIGGDGFDTLDLTDTGASSITLSGNTVTTPEFGSYAIDSFEAVRGSYANNVIRGDDYKSYHLYGGAGHDLIYAGDMGDHVYGDAGNDILIGGTGDDTLYGGDGQDTMAGESGNDTYVYNGMGIVDTISDTGGDADRILFGGGLKIEDMQLSYDGSTLDILFNWQRLLEVLNATGTGAIERIDFEGGSSYDVVNESYLLHGTENGETIVAIGWQSRLFGFGGDDVLDGLWTNAIFDGGAGNDTMIGGDGWDTYLFSSGRDIIEESDSMYSTYDVLFFGEGYQSAYLQFYRVVDLDAAAHDDLIIDDGIGNTVTIRGQYALVPSAIEELRFSDDIWTKDMQDGYSLIYTEFLSTAGLSVTTYGSENNNVLHGLQVGASPNDQIYGFGGDDTIWAYDGDDVIAGGVGDDTLYGGAGDDMYVFSRGDGVDLISDEDGDDVIRFDETVDSASVVYAREGDDLVISYGTGTDTLMVTGFFNDLNASLRIEKVIFDMDDTEHTADDIIAFVDTSVEDLTLTGTTGVDTLTGGAGNDTLDGLAGADTLTGGAGDDTYVVDDAGDVVVENIDEGTDLVQASVTYSLSANVENLTLTGTSNIHATGNALNNILVGNTGANTLNGGVGADTMFGGIGADTYIVDDAGDVIVEEASQGIDTVHASVSYTLVDHVENLLLTGAGHINGTGNDLGNVITGNDGNNQLFGNGGNDTLNGGLGADTMAGGTGDDLYIVDNAGDAVSENISEGTDAVQASVNYSLGANVENLILTGTANINGTGNAGNNTLSGNSGNNTLAGGLGDDTYIFTSAGGNDVVSETGGSDIIRFDATVDALSITYTRNGDDLVIAYGVGTDKVTVVGFFDENSTSGRIETVIFDENETSDSYADILAAVDTPESGLTLTGTAGIDTLVGGSGDDTLNGLAGADTLIGAAGNDLYIIDNIGDVVVENASEGEDTVLSSVTYTLSSNVENLTLTGTAAIHGTGNALSNVITGNSGNNSLNGGAGADTLIGGAGGDTYIVDNTEDVVIENLSEGNDIILASVSYTLSANVERLTLMGADHINAAGNGLANTLIGNSGNNTLDGGAGADRMEGGAGNDVYIVDNASDTIVENASAGADVVYASVDYTLVNNVENLILSGTGNINGTGNGLNNTLIGNTGNNTLNGGAGADTMIGGAGNDTYTVDNGGDIVIELTDEGEDTVRSYNSYTLGNHIEHLTLIGSAANLVGIGNSLDNSLVGSTGVNTLIGGAGNDMYVVDNVNDIVIEEVGEGIDTVRSSVSYTLSANIENLILTGISNLAGTGNVLDNTITGNTGINTLDGGEGADILIGGDGSDRYIVDNVGDVIVEAYNEGMDTVLSSISYTLSANVEYLTLTGTANINGYGNEINNIVRGNAGNNTLMGYAGNDTLDGELGADTMIGGEGGDTYIVDDIGDTVIEDGSSGTDTVEASISYTLVDNIERLFLTGTANINATGNALNNSIVGNSGNNTLIGGGGNDRMEGGAGNDLYYVDSEGDVVIETSGGGTDHVISSISYVLGSYVENLTLTGTGDFTGGGNNLHNTIIGNIGNNILGGGGGGGSDTLIGGLGNDTYSVDHANDVIIELEGEGIDSVISSVSWALGEHFEHLQLENSALYGIGNNHDNTLRGNNSSNTLIGYGGNDYLDGGSAGVDTLIGGTGDDHYVVSHSYDVVIEEEDEGIDTIQTSVHWTLGAAFENLVAGGGTGLTLIGNNANNIIIGSTGNNYIDGGAGADTMSGGVGNDTYFVDNVGDVVIEQSPAGSGTDDTVISSVSYTLSENIEFLTLTGTDDLNGTGNSGQNTITGNSGNNTLDGGANYDRMIGGAGDDVYIVDDLGDVVIEYDDAGVDLVMSSVTYTISGGVENLTLTGTDNINGSGNSLANIIIGNNGNNLLSGLGGDDILFGGAGDDSLNGGLGNDTLHGGAGTDTLTGSSNADIFVFGVDSYGSIDVVTDFSAGAGDAIDIRDLLDSYDSGTDDVTEWVRITTSGSNSIVEVDRDGTGTGYGWTQIATLNGVTGLTDEAALVVAGNLLVA